MRTDTKSLRNLRNRITPLGDLRYCITLEIVTKTRIAHYGLLASNLGKKASTNPGAIQFRVLEQCDC
ncbi:hypothetical protein LP7551_02102 [Roseibium album]|nr:hypothetical protein LP7551_02102 [Roseibium album]